METLDRHAGIATSLCDGWEIATAAHKGRKARRRDPANYRQYCQGRWEQESVGRSLDATVGPIHMPKEAAERTKDSG